MASSTTTAQSRDLQAHKTWLGLLEGQRVGIVVTPPALVAAQAYANTDVIPAQNALLGLLTDRPRDLRDAIAERWGESGDVVLKRLGPFCEAVLGWRPDDLCPVAPDDARWSVHLPEQRETLSPTHVLMDPDARGGPPAPLLLVREEPANTDLDALPPERADGGGWRASPETRFERLLRDTGVSLGLLFNGASLRLVYAPRAETPGHLTFPVRAMCEVGGRPILAGLVMLLHESRLFTGPKAQRLPALLVESRKYQSTVSTQLAGQVLDALHALVRGFQAANEVDPRGRGELLREVLVEDRAQVYGGLLTTLMRLVFVLYAEDRALLPAGGIYPGSYSVTGLFERLREDAGRHPDTMHARYGAWAQLLTLFRVLHDGAHAREMQIPPRAGHLFNPDAYPFLEGRAHGTRRGKGERITPPLVSDGVIYEVLGLLLYLDGDRLSYRALEVEQIGSVYEAMMGFTLEQARGRSIAVLPHHVVIGLEEALALSETARDKLLVEAGCKLADAAQKAWKSAKNEAALVAALGRKVSPQTPDVLPQGALYLQPTEERRRSGSHYTPRELTEPIVRTTLQPQLDALAAGKTPRAEQILALKVCDPAMGSGAFLVESCRFLAAALDAAWGVHGDAPVIPPDEDRELHARRLVAQRCLYGVDKNPFAVDLAKLSLWLFTLAKDHPFTFLDHALLQGDSLVGLSTERIACFDWKDTGKPSLLLRPRLATVLKAVEQKRGEIHALSDSSDVAEKSRRLDDAEDLVADVRAIADLAVLAFFSEKKDAAREKHRKRLGDTVVEPFLSGRLSTHSLRERADELRTLTPPVTPFHWELEFPEVFARENPGFDAFVGNPPFAGKNTLLASGGPLAVDWLKALHEGSHGNADLVAHFFRRAFSLLRRTGAFGLIATNTVAQGDTRGTGLRWIVQHGGVIYAAKRRYKWPGAAAVIVSVVHVQREGSTLTPELDGKPVPRISAFLVANEVDEDPATLTTNQERSFIGSYVLGMGFTFDDTDKKKRASTLAEMKRLIDKDPRNAERIFPYLGGEELNTSPSHAYHRYAINFEQMTEEEAHRWPDLMEVVERKVKPERTGNKRDVRRRYWWRFGEPAPALYKALNGKARTIANSQVSAHHAFAFQPTDRVFAHTLNVFALDSNSAFAVLQARPHESWARFFASSMKDDVRYTPSDCFETFPFPPDWQSNPVLEATGKTYYEFRAALMVKNDEGLTKTYNRFHDPDERSPEVLKLRALHAEMDRAVLDAYGWQDVPTACEFLLDHDDGAEDDDEGGKKRKRKPYRYRWPDEVRDEVLARLIELNRVRAEDERKRGVAVARDARKLDDEDDDGDD
ncbi:Eco57I restriction-modification methylase domain-containing protein [Sorangium sp. So ce887]|uniref:Eco57I restriction-modification methylase domain-containing protein n=1 Tax=Sorangium sp. So ce887 TaxID=3133324 RepID=UPI003F5F463A